jgi:hypothetical protein
MPFKSEKQRRYLHANHPEIAKRWERDYAHGGILDINESEEIISNDGNEIELTDYNAAFDEPTGVQSLFKAKDGGKTIKGQEHMLAYITPGEAKTLENLGGQKTMTKEGIPAYPPSDNYGGTHGSSSRSSSSSSRDTGSNYGQFDRAVSRAANNPPATTSSGGDQEDDVAQMMSNMGLTQDHSPRGGGWVGSEDEQTQIGGSDYIGPKDQIRIRQDIVQRKEKWDKDKWKRDAKTAYSGFSAITNPLSFAKFVYDQNKKKNERIAEIEYDLSLLDKIGTTKFSPHTDTIYQTLEQEKLDLLQPTTRDTPDDDPDGPGVPEVAPIGEEIQEYASMAPDAGATLASIRSRQALNAQLQAKWAAEKEARDQLYMVANKGGLANLFRVKKQ